VKVNSVFLRDSTAITDSILLLFGGSIQQGGLVSLFALLIQEVVVFQVSKSIVWVIFCSMLQDGHLKMLGGYLEFFMNRDLASTYLSLKSELESLIHSKVFTDLLCLVLCQYSVFSRFFNFRSYSLTSQNSGCDNSSSITIYKAVIIEMNYARTACFCFLHPSIEMHYCYESYVLF